MYSDFFLKKSLNQERKGIETFNRSWWTFVNCPIESNGMIENVATDSKMVQETFKESCEMGNRLVMNAKSDIKNFR